MLRVSDVCLNKDLIWGYLCGQKGEKSVQDYQDQQLKSTANPGIPLMHMLP